MKFCPQCGSSNDDNVRFCGKCGAGMGDAPAPTVTVPTGGASTGKRTGLRIAIAAVAVIAVAAAAGAAYFLWPMSESEYEDRARQVLKDGAEAFVGVYEAIEEFAYAADESDSSDEIDEDAVKILRDAFEQYSEDVKALDRDVRALRPPAKYRDADMFLRGVASYLSGDSLEKIDELISELEKGMTFDELEDALEDLGKALAFYDIWEGLDEELGEELEGSGPSSSARERTCYSNQRVIDGSVQQYMAADPGNSYDDVEGYVDWESPLILEYIKEPPVCPSTGEYYYVYDGSVESCPEHGSY